MPESRGSGTGLLIGGVVIIGGYFAYKRFVVPQIVTPIKTAQYVERIRLGKIYAIKLKGDTITFKFPIENPNTRPMIIKAIVGNVFITSPKLGKIKIGQVAHFGTDTIKPVGQTDFDLAVKVNLVNEFAILSQELAGNMQGQAITFNGTITANGRPWPVNETFQIS